MDNGTSLDVVLADENEIFAENPGTGLFDLPTSSTRILTNNGSASFTDGTQTLLPLAFGDTARGTALALGDVDGDGDDDLMLTSDRPEDRQFGDNPTSLFEWR